MVKEKNKECPLCNGTGIMGKNQVGDIVLCNCEEKNKSKEIIFWKTKFIPDFVEEKNKVYDKILQAYSRYMKGLSIKAELEELMELTYEDETRKK